MKPQTKIAYRSKEDFILQTSSMHGSIWQACRPNLKQIMGIPRRVGDPYLDWLVPYLVRWWSLWMTRVLGTFQNNCKMGKSWKLLLGNLETVADSLFLPQARWQGSFWLATHSLCFVLLLLLLLLFPYEVENYYFLVCDGLCWNFDQDCIESYQKQSTDSILSIF